MIDPIWDKSERTGSDATRAPASLARVWRGYILCAYLDNNEHSDKVYTTLFDPYVHQRWDGSPNISTPDRDIVRSIMPPAIGYCGLATVIITCGSAKDPHAAQPVARVIGYPFSADKLGDFHQVTAGVPLPLPVNDCDSGTRPALAFRDDTMVFIYRSTKGNLRVVFGSFAGQPRWTGQADFTNHLVNDGPALTVLKNTFHCSYIGPSGLAAIQSSADGRNWSGEHQVPVKPVHGPALSAGPRGEQLRLMYVQAGGTKIWGIISGDGVHWSEPAEHPDALSSAAPALIGSGAGVMLCVYKGEKNGDLYSTCTRPGAYLMI